MELINTSPVPVKFDLAGKIPDDACSVVFQAKATFRIEENGRVILEKETPIPLWDEDQLTDLGIKPRDNLPRLDPAFEVMLLGNAYAPDGYPTGEMKVRLAVGDVNQELDVIGERIWQGEGDDARMTQPEAFETMPMVWERAFGGTETVLIDNEAELDVSSTLNADGKGFDHIEKARELGVAFECPEGYPQFEPIRPLPNLESPGERVQSWSDDPLPLCWAPLSHSSGMIVERLQRSCDTRGVEFATLNDPEMQHRAHPDWVIETPAAGAVVRLEGASPKGLIQFRIPQLRVVADFSNGGKVQVVELHPRSLVLLPEESRFYLTYSATLRFDTREDEKRAIRVRLLNGWRPDERRQSP